MTVNAGSRLGPYEIVSHIGSGGMGEVYKARDTRLNRDVAIKVLPALFARDPDRMARLEQEARAAAALNAPGIVAIHDIGTADEAGKPVMYVVMELLEGESLRGRLDEGPVPPRKAAEFASQIAAALAVAHARGIVHRDLKPENLFITKDGRIKILDFGLAKAEAAAAVGSIATAVAGTAAGTVLGTVGYMAPEQVRGEPADARSDIFALGATLYEMLAGRRAFSRASAVETMNAILNEDPPEIAPEVSAVIPGALQAILSRCLEKRPEDRFHSAHDLALALQAAGSGRATTSGVERVMAKRSSSRAGVIFGVAGLAIGGAAIVAAFWLARTPAAVPTVASLRQLTEAPGAEINPDISPDGRQVLYASASSGNFDLYLLRVGGGRAINLTANSPGADAQGAFSPDGEQIAFRSDRDGGGIFVMGATGESARRITSAGFDPRWSPDGKQLAYATEGVRDPYSRSVIAELWTVDVSSGAAKRLVNGDAVQPSWSPSGERIAFWSNTGGQRDIVTIAAAGGTPVAVTQDAATDWAPEWSPDGRWLYFVSDRGGSPNLWRVAIDQPSGAVRGSPEPVTNGVRALASARFARDGSRMVIGATDRSFELASYSFEPRGDPPTLRSTMRSASLGWCAPSPDASWLACTSRGGQEDIVLLRADGAETRRLTDDAFKDRIPVWSPDGRTLSFMSTRSGRWELWTIGADGSGLRQLTDLKGDVAWGAWSPDGKQLAVAPFIVMEPGVWLVDVATRMATRENSAFMRVGSARVGIDAWSSDGRLLAGIQLNAAGDPLAIEVWDVKEQRIHKHIEMPLLRATTIDVSFVPGTHSLVASAPDGVVLVDGDTGAARRILPQTPPYGTRLSGDGRTLLVERPAIEADLWLMEFKR
ncbi:MAG TPA: protein kinase [Vicinamibacterales bacterium]|nr:protein kinase [Vicinamibacterales bacterium]